MLPAPFKVVLDACVLFPFMLRDTLLWAALKDFYQPYWSVDILDELVRGVQKPPKAMSAENAQCLRAAMEAKFPEAMVTGHHGLIPCLDLPDPDDRHVLAAAIRIGAQVIVTRNLDDFPPSALASYDIEAQHPNVFLADLLDLNPALMLLLLHQQATAKKKPITFERLMRSLETNDVPDFAAEVWSIEEQMRGGHTP